MFSKVMCVDFDGTMVKHAYPEIGDPVPDAVRVIKRAQENHWMIILWTMRGGRELQAAVDYCTDNGIYLFGVNSNPEQSEWTQSPKAYAQIYIDDAALGCPLVKPHPHHQQRPWVDWVEVERLLFGGAS